MKHYKDNQNNLFGFENNAVVPQGLIEITIDEVNEINRLSNQDTFDQLSYDKKRVRKYPDFRDYLDGIVKGDQAQVQAYIDACLAVKAKYPKE